MIKYLQLQKTFDASKMQAELASLGPGWQEHYNKAHYEGEWSILPLRSIDGNAENPVSVHGAAGDRTWKNTRLLEGCPYIHSVINFFETEKNAVRLMKLDPGAMIKEHRDPDLSFEDGEVRLHIPVITNPRVGFYLEDEQVIMQEGECWYLNLSLPHRVKNEGDIPRVHLVIDCTVNDWVKSLFANCSRISKITGDAPAAKSYSHEEQLQIINELKILNTPTSLGLAAAMEKEITEPAKEDIRI